MSECRVVSQYNSFVVLLDDTPKLIALDKGTALMQLCS